MFEKKVLIIDDDPKILEVFGIELRNRGFQVQVAQNGEEAITEAKNFGPDIIISDIKMPDIDGISLTQKFKQHEEFHNVPFIIISAFSNEIDKVKAEKIGADGFLEKPVNFEHLTAKINNLLKKRGGNSVDTNVLFSGVLSEMPVLDVAQVLHLGHKTGVLKIFTMTGTIGEIVYHKGEIVACSYPPFFSNAAFYHLVRITSGEFKLIPLDGTPLRNLWIPTSKLIMEAATNLDEFDTADINNQLFLPVGKRFWIQGRKLLSELSASLAGVLNIIVLEKSGRILISLNENYENSINIASYYLNLSRMCIEHDSSSTKNLFLLRMGKRHIVFHHIKANFILCLELSPDTQIGVILTKVRKKIPEIAKIIS